MPSVIEVANGQFLAKRLNDVRYRVENRRGDVLGEIAYAFPVKLFMWWPAAGRCMSDFRLESILKLMDAINDHSGLERKDAADGHA